jgi:hypothetical protein
MREFTTTAASAVAGGRAAYYVLYGWASYPKTPARLPTSTGHSDRRRYDGA